MRRYLTQTTSVLYIVKINTGTFSRVCIGYVVSHLSPFITSLFLSSIRFWSKGPGKVEISFFSPFIKRSKIFHLWEKFCFYVAPPQKFVTVDSRTVLLPTLRTLQLSRAVFPRAAVTFPECCCRKSGYGDAGPPRDSPSGSEAAAADRNRTGES